MTMLFISIELRIDALYAFHTEHLPRCRSKIRIRNASQKYPDRVELNRVARPGGPRRTIFDPSPADELAAWWF